MFDREWERERGRGLRKLLACALLTESVRMNDNTKTQLQKRKVLYTHTHALRQGSAWHSAMPLSVYKAWAIGQMCSAEWWLMLMTGQMMTGDPCMHSALVLDVWCGGGDGGMLAIARDIHSVWAMWAVRRIISAYCLCMPMYARHTNTVKGKSRRAFACCECAIEFCMCFCECVRFRLNDGSVYIEATRAAGILRATVGSCRGIGCIWFCVNNVGDASSASEGLLNGWLSLSFFVCCCFVFSLQLCHDPMYHSSLLLTERCGIVLNECAIQFYFEDIGDDGSAACSYGQLINEEFYLCALANAQFIEI